MEKILLSQTEVYVVENDIQAQTLIKEAKENDEGYELKKYTDEAKQKKVKGEIVASYHKVTLVKVFEEEKELF